MIEILYITHLCNFTKYEKQNSLDNKVLTLLILL